jgi:hypothetical protein
MQMLYGFKEESDAESFCAQQSGFGAAVWRIASRPVAFSDQ